MSNNNFLITIVGPTAVGKTSVSIQLAKHYGCEIISADSRQFFKGMAIGTAKPTSDEMEGVPHHFIDFLGVEEEMSAGAFEVAAVDKLRQLFAANDKAILIGGSGLYIKAVTEGMSEMPTPPPEIRRQLMVELEKNGFDGLLKELERRDPDYFEHVDQKNHQRVVRALEMIRFTGNPFSSFRNGPERERDFNIVKIGLELEREVLYRRINERVDEMIAVGLEEEVISLKKKKDLNALQTVGYKEIFDYLDGHYDREEAIRLIKRNTRRYAKRQLTWFKKDEEVKWFYPTEISEIVAYIDQSIS